MTSDYIIPQYLIDFVAESTKSFDASHNLEHALKVTDNMHKIMQSLNEPYDKLFATTIAMLHDVCDHKYPNSITQDTLEKFIYRHNGIDTPRITNLIENVSWSKESKGLTNLIHKLDERYLIGLTDADRLEALGKGGLDRCITFLLANGGNVPEDVIKHCHEKLLKLYTDNYIKTNYARELAKPLHEEIVVFVNSSK